MDAYQQAVEYLTKNPDKIHAAWNNAPSVLSRGGCLFVYVTKDPFGFGSYSYGCLTQVHGEIKHACLPELTQAIQKDERLPDHPSKITVDHLPVFAQWQRYIDKVLERTPPKLDPELPVPTQINFEPLDIERLLVAETSQAKEENDEQDHA